MALDRTPTKQRQSRSERRKNQRHVDTSGAFESDKNMHKKQKIIPLRRATPRPVE